MKQSEKLDLILRELYKHKHESKYYYISVICKTLSIPYASINELYQLTDRLHDDGYVIKNNTLEYCSAKITSSGIEYCEENSYSYFGHPINTNKYNISIVNSPNSNIVTQSSDVTITQNISQANHAIEKIREAIATDQTIDDSNAKDIIECLNEIQKSLENNQKPKFAIKSLLGIASNIASISSWVTILGQYAGLIPIL